MTKEDTRYYLSDVDRRAWITVLFSDMSEVPYPLKKVGALTLRKYTPETVEPETVVREGKPERLKL